ncbi:MAG TPA: tyrosine-type recombinase/integrase [Candidatus Dormibacteraeota bacterium]|nr:tyrosine-type recombinase/integrase [Candidatus Dormibacteraeota bacterium]
MKLSSAIENYVTLKRSLGAVFSSNARILRSLSRALGDIHLEAITPEDCRKFCRGKGLPTRFWELKHGSLRGFFRHLVSRGFLVSSPLQEPAPRVLRTFRPYIYSHEGLRRLLEPIGQEQSYRRLLEPETLRTIILLLYGAGLRAGEALRLRPCDVNFQEQVLSIWDTKFFKSRLVPIGASLAAALTHYAQERQRVHPSDERFFTTRTGKGVRLGLLEAAFVRLRERAGIRRPSTDRWQPRLHDLRATFAVHRLIAWYREGVDLHSRLPLLSTYLGHVNISGTQAYLPMTHELLAEASRRFERYAQPKEDFNA